MAAATRQPATKFETVSKQLPALYYFHSVMPQNKAFLMTCTLQKDSTYKVPLE